MELISASNKAKTADNLLIIIQNATYLYTSLVQDIGISHNCKYLIIPNKTNILGFDAIFGLDLIKRFNIQLMQVNNEMIATCGNCQIGGEVRLPPLTAATICTNDSRDDQIKAKLDDLLIKFGDVFSEEATSLMNIEPMQIRLTGQELVKAKLRRQSLEDIVEMQSQIQKLLDNKIIEPSQSPFSSNAHLVPKKNGQKRLVVNFIPLNNITVKDHFPMPQLCDLFSSLKEAEFFAALDCTEGFFQLPILREHRERTAFITPQGLYQFRRCPFGFTNSPAHFQRAMNDIFAEGLYKKCVIYIDDILVFGKSEDELLSNLEWVLQQCQQRRVQLKLSKCKILQKEVEFLGFRISKNKIGPVPGKYDNIATQTPRSKKDVRAILGKLNYYSRFIHNYSEETKPMRQLTKKHVTFEWTEEHQKSLERLKKALDSAVANKIPDSYSPKTLEILIGDQSVEAVCFDQEEELISRASVVLSEAEVNYTPVEKHLIGIVLAYDKFGPYLRGEVIVRTTCRELGDALKMKEKTQRMNKRLLRLPPDANFKIEVIPKSALIETEVRSQDPPDEVFYTDGACTKNGTPECKATWAIVATMNPKLTTVGVVSHPKPSNQVAELVAIIEACKLAKTENLDKILIVTDSRYAASAITKWLRLWPLNGWKDNRGKPIANELLFKELLQAMDGITVNCIHVKGHSGDINNSKADHLARSKLEESIDACLLLAARPDFSQHEDEEIEFIKLNLAIDPKLAERYTVIDDKLYYIDPLRPATNRNRLVVPNSSRQLILSVAHDDPIYGGHLGVKKTRYKLANYYWPRMIEDIEQYIKTCELCQHHKTPKQRRYGLLQPIAVSKVFERVHIDIVGPIKKSQSNSQYIVTAIDAFSRWGLAKAYPDVKTSDIICFFEDEIICRHGLPEQVVSDNGTQFVSRQFEEYLKELGIRHNRTSIYHPAANGMDERFNGSLVKIIRNYTESNQTDWDKHIKWALFIYNTTRNESTLFSPYNLLYGFEARTPLTVANQPVEEEILDQAKLEEIRRTGLQNMTRAQDVQKRNHDAHRRQEDFKVFDLVMIKSFAPPRGDSRKLAFSWIGPAMVLKIIQHNDQPQALEILEFEKFKAKTVAFQDVKHFNQRHQGAEEESVEHRESLPGEVVKRLKIDDGVDHFADDECFTSLTEQSRIDNNNYNGLNGDPFLTDARQEQGQTALEQHVEPVASECLTSESASNSNQNYNYNDLDGDPFPTDVRQKQGQTALEQHVEPTANERLTPESINSLSQKNDDGGMTGVPLQTDMAPPRSVVPATNDVMTVSSENPTSALQLINNQNINSVHNNPVAPTDECSASVSTTNVSIVRPDVPNMISSAPLANTRSGNTMATGARVTRVRRQIKAPQRFSPDSK